MLGARTHKCHRDVSSDQKMTEGKVMVKVTMTFRIASLLAMYNMIQVSDIGPSWPSCFLIFFICCGYSFELHQQVNAIQMGTRNICLYKEVDWLYSEDYGIA